MTSSITSAPTCASCAKRARGHQEQLAEHAGLNRSYVGEIERGEAIASIVTADKIARAFDVSISTLLPGAYVT